jgi:small multidrug resistance pump
MDKRFWAILIAILMSIVGVIGDSFLKRASSLERPLMSNWFLAGLATFSLTAFGWVYAMRHLKLATIGVLYSVSTVLSLIFIGTVFFEESLDRYEILGIGLAIVSLVLLGRFS